MTLNSFYHESFKKWLKGKCSPQADSVDNFFDDGGIKAHYDTEHQLFIIDPSEKTYALQDVENIIYNEEEFNSLITHMLE